MAADQSVFVPDQPHHENIEDGQNDEAETVVSKHQDFSLEPL
jgi:hypothetical protein